MTCLGTDLMWEKYQNETFPVFCLSFVKLPFTWRIFWKQCKILVLWIGIKDSKILSNRIQWALHFSYRTDALRLKPNASKWIDKKYSNSKLIILTPIHYFLQLLRSNCYERKYQNNGNYENKFTLNQNPWVRNLLFHHD